MRRCFPTLWYRKRLQIAHRYLKHGILVHAYLLVPAHYRRYQEFTTIYYQAYLVFHLIVLRMYVWCDLVTIWNILLTHKTSLFAFTKKLFSQEMWRWLIIWPLFILNAVNFFQCSIHYASNEQTGVAVMLLTCIRHVLGSNFGRDIDYPDCDEWTPIVREITVLSGLQSLPPQIKVGEKATLLEHSLKHTLLFNWGRDKFNRAIMYRFTAQAWK